MPLPPDYATCTHCAVTDAQHHLKPVEGSSHRFEHKDTTRCQAWAEQLKKEGKRK